MDKCAKLAMLCLVFIYTYKFLLTNFSEFFLSFFELSFIFLIQHRFLNFLITHCKILENIFYLYTRYLYTRVVSVTGEVNYAVSIYNPKIPPPSSSFIPGIDAKLSKLQSIHVKNCLSACTSSFSVLSFV